MDMTLNEMDTVARNELRRRISEHYAEEDSIIYDIHFDQDTEWKRQTTDTGLTVYVSDFFCKVEYNLSEHSRYTNYLVDAYTIEVGIVDRDNILLSY